MKIKYLSNAVRFCCDDRIELIVSQVIAGLDYELEDWENDCVYRAA